MVTIPPFVLTCCLLEYFPLLPEDDKFTLQMIDTISDFRCICRDVRDHVDLHAARHLVKRKVDRLAHIAEEYPTFRQDCGLFGTPSVVMPLPMWKVWRVQEWWYVETWRVENNIEWILSETHWINHLADLAPLEKKPSGKPFTFRRFYLRSFVWDYECRWWVEEDQI